MDPYKGNVTKLSDDHEKPSTSSIDASSISSLSEKEVQEQNDITYPQAATLEHLQEGNRILRNGLKQFTRLLDDNNITYSLDVFQGIDLGFDSLEDPPHPHQGQQETLHEDTDHTYYAPPYPHHTYIYSWSFWTICKVRWTARSHKTRCFIKQIRAPI